MSERQQKRLAQKEFNRLKRRTIEKVLSNTKPSNLAFSLNYLVDGWQELDSDPGTFSLLIEDFGCYGARVEEIYDLEQKFDCPVLGFIFLFKWMNHQQTDRSRNQKSTPTHNTNNNSCNNGDNKSNNSTRNTNNVNEKEKETNEHGEQQPPEERQWSYVEDESIISKMFFAKQMISNSCATHALVSILLNCDHEHLHLGPHLTRLKEHTKTMDPENRGYAIGNLPEIAKAHNSHASYSNLYERNNLSSSHSGVSFMVSGNQRTSLQQQKHHEAYHFVSYVPIKNRLYELDGLKNFPIDHGPINPNEDWTDKFRRVVKRRLSGNDIMYNLMAVVPDRRFKLRSQLRRLRTYDRHISSQVKMLTNRVLTNSQSTDVDIPRPPYSPLSTGTQTASEACNSPNRLKDDFSSEDEDNNNNSNNYYCIKFGESSENCDKYPEPAHGNCKTQTVSMDGLDMTKKLLDKKVEPNPPVERQADKSIEESVQVSEKKSTDKVVDKPSEETDKLNERFQESSTRRSSRVSRKSATEISSMEIDEPQTPKQDKTCTSMQSPHLDNGKTKELDASKVMIEETCDVKMKPIIFQTIEEVSENEIVRKEEKEELDGEPNTIMAHNDEKYNLSGHPPFEFNIIDEMQHIHIDKSTIQELKCVSKKIQLEMQRVTNILDEENQKLREYRIERSRRTHNYEPFIMTFLSMLAKQGNLADLIEREDNPNHQSTPKTTSTTNPAIQQTPHLNNNNLNANNNTSATTKGVPSAATATHAAAAHRQKGKIPTKPKYRYVKTGRPVGRPRKNPPPNANAS